MGDERYYVVFVVGDKHGAMTFNGPLGTWDEIQAARKAVLEEALKQNPLTRFDSIQIINWKRID